MLPGQMQISMEKHKLDLFGAIYDINSPKVGAYFKY